MFHAVPLLWRLHMVHHTDFDFDVTTGLRFHTFEILLSAVIKLAVVLVLGPPIFAVLIFEVPLNATSMFNHSNIRISDRLDRFLRLFVVTPDVPCASFNRSIAKQTAISDSTCPGGTIGLAHIALNLRRATRR